MEFLKLEKIEFGGIKGKMLSEQTVQIFEEFNDLYKMFAESNYDCLDLKDDVRWKYLCVTLDIRKDKKF